MDERLPVLATAEDEPFDRLAGISALAAALLALAYAIAFVVLGNAMLYSVALMAGGLFSTVALFAVYRRVRPAGALGAVGLVLGLAGALGAAVHGAYDLAVVLHPEEGVLGGGPFPVDPRGFLTFGVAGLGLLLLSWAGLTIGALPRALLYVGLLLGILLIVVYLARLIVLDAASPLVLVPAALAGLVVSPLWYGWLGWLLLTRRA